MASLISPGIPVTVDLSTESFPITLRNESLNKFVDISSESYRTYVFPGGNEVTIKEPTQLSVNAGGHRLLDYYGMSYYVPKGWILLKWAAKHGHPHFVK